MLCSNVKLDLSKNNNMQSLRVMIQQIPRGVSICSCLCRPCPIVGKGSSSLGFSQLQHHQPDDRFQSNACLDFLTHASSLVSHYRKHSLKCKVSLWNHFYLALRGDKRTSLSKKILNEDSQLVKISLKSNCPATHPPTSSQGLDHDEGSKSHGIAWDSVNSETHLSYPALWLIVWCLIQGKVFSVPFDDTCHIQTN